MKNNELINRAFGLLRPMLAGYIAQQMRIKYGEQWWDVVLAVNDNDPMLTRSTSYEDRVDSLDTAACLKTINRQWRDVFRDQQNIDFLTYIRELQGFRNRSAHIGGRDVDADDTYRALDTMQRVAKKLDEETSEELREMALDFRAGAFDEQKRKKISTDSQGVLTKTESKLPSWREVMRPHPDVANGGYQKAEFAADLNAVASHKKVAIEYSDPVEFFKRTYITEGLENLLEQALKRVTSGDGDPVIQLKTAFGGGKTHSMLALYHMLNGSLPTQEASGLKPVLNHAGVNELPKANVAVLVGTALPVDKRSRKLDMPGISVSTLWGEMAYQLARNKNMPELYELVKDADKKGVSPGSDALVELFDKAGPCVILLDEMVNYAKKLKTDSTLPAGTFDNFIAFVQELTEAAKVSKNTLVVASIPESETEIGGEAGIKALKAIEHTFGRVEAIWKPVSVNEGFEVVRRRLFLDCDQPELRDEICEAYANMYQNNPSAFPYAATQPDYEKRLKACYPIHPEVFDRLFNEWSSLPEFQRTRGVLRLMAAVIFELWNNGDASSMILPGSIPLDAPKVRDELTKHLPQGWASIIHSEIDGQDSAAFMNDSRDLRFNNLMANRRLTRDLFLATAPNVAGQVNRGISKNEIHLGVVQPKEETYVFDDALNKLRKELSYLYSDDSENQYWFDTRPSLNKTAKERSVRISLDAAYLEIIRRLQKIRKSTDVFAGIHCCPNNSSDISDEQKVRLVILKPEYTFRVTNKDDLAVRICEEYLDNRGSMHRSYKNMLVFLAADDDNIGRLIQNTRDYMAWKSIQDEQDNLNLDKLQLKEVKKNLEIEEGNVNSSLVNTYSRVLVPSIDTVTGLTEIEWSAFKTQGYEGSIIQKAAAVCRGEEAVIVSWAPMLLRLTLMQYFWDKGSDISISDVWKSLCSYLYLPRLKDFEVFKNCVVEGVDQKDTFGIASDIENGEYLNVKCNESVHEIHQSDYLIPYTDAQAALVKQNEKDNPGQDEIEPVSPGAGPSFINPVEPVIPVSPVSPTTPAVEQDKPVTFTMVKKLDPVRVSKEVRDIVEEIITLLNNVDGKLEIKLSLKAYMENGLTKREKRDLAENCTNLDITDFSIDED